ncbi:MAG: acyl carrier protein [Burkholderiaceae bacterium]|nr:acyl carrier protein [Burkholderiaceae bacterium]
MSIEQQVRNYILENFLFTNDASALANDVSFLEKGIVDSTGVLEMILFLEQEFAIKVADSEMVPENLDTVGNIVHYVQSKHVGK